MAFLFIFLAKITILTFNKPINKFSILTKGIFGQRNKEYDLKEIKEVELSATYQASKEGDKIIYNLTILCLNGETIKLNSSTTAVSPLVVRTVPERVAGIKIANFLNVPFQERQPQTISSVISAIKTSAQTIKNNNF